MKQKALDEEEIYLNYIVALHKLAKEKNIKTEVLTTDNKLTKYLNKLAKAQFTMNKNQMKECKKKCQERIRILCKT